MYKNAYWSFATSFLHNAYALDASGSVPDVDVEKTVACSHIFFYSSSFYPMILNIPINLSYYITLWLLQFHFLSTTFTI